MDLREFDERARRLGVLGYIVTVDGREIASARFDEECRRNVYSASKSFTSAAVGLAAKEGLLRLDERVVDAFREDLPEKIEGYWEEARVRDLLTMCLGQEKASLMGGQRVFLREDDWVRLSLSIPLSLHPGEKFVYNNVGPYLAGVLVQRRAGCDLVSYLTPRLFRKLGIRRPTWEADPLGYTFGAGGLFLALSELHRLGILYRDGGIFDGTRILPESWVGESVRPQDDPGYGYLFWRGEYDSFRADGKYGQLSIVFPGKNAVVTVVAECRDTPSLFRALYDTLYPEIP